MKRIVIPTDFSSSADTAINFAVQSAKIIPVELTLFHAFDLIRNIYADYMGIGLEFVQPQIEDINKKMKELKKTIEDTHGVRVNILVAVDSFKVSLLQTIEDEKIDMVIMGTLGASGIKEKLWGTNTSSIIGKAKIPILAIPANYEWKKPEKFLLATNQFENEPSILNFLFELADLYMAQVHIAVMTDEDDQTAETFFDHTQKMLQHEKMLKQEYNEESLTATHLYGKDFEETLQQHVKEKNIDLLVMVAYSRSFWNRIYNPSKTKRMSYHTRTPLLVFHGKEVN